MRSQKQEKVNITFVVLLVSSSILGLFAESIKIEWISKTLVVIMYIIAFILAGLILSMFEIGLNKMNKK